MFDAFVYPTDMLTGGILTWLAMFGAENASLCNWLQLAFDFPSGGLLPCLMPIYLYMFDRWYPDMIWHVWSPVASNTSERRSADMFWHL